MNLAHLRFCLLMHLIMLLFLLMGLSVLIPIQNIVPTIILTLDQNTYTLHAFVNVSLAGDYIITVSLFQSSFHITTVKSENCITTTDASNIIGGSSINIRAKQLNNDEVNESTDIMLNKPICNVTNIKDFSKGAYVNAAKAAFGDKIKSIRPDDDSVWSPHACHLKILDKTEAQTCLKGKWIAFAGDSTSKELALLFITVLGWSFDNAWLPYADITLEDRIWDSCKFNTGLTLRKFRSRY